MFHPEEHPTYDSEPAPVAEPDIQKNQSDRKDVNFPLDTKKAAQGGLCVMGFIPRLRQPARP
jgi:hypothetical protein